MSRCCKYVMLWGALALSAWTAPAFGAAAAPLGLREALDIRYSPGAGDRHTLDVFAPPARADGKLVPVVLFVHGGAWMMGDKDFFGESRGVGRFLANHGAVAVLINYQLSPFVKHPEHIKDVAQAFAWTRRHIRAHGGDPDHIVLCGHSAGGHLVSLLATDGSYLSDPALKLGPADRAALCGVMSVSGVYRIPGPEEFRVMMNQIVDIYVNEMVGDGESPGAAWLAAALRQVGEQVSPFRLVFGTDRAVQVQASPESHVRKGLPPFLVLYAESEVPGLTDMARDFVQALRRTGNSVETSRIDGRTHRDIMVHVNDPGDETGRALLAFIHRVAGRRS